MPLISCLNDLNSMRTLYPSMLRICGPKLAAMRHPQSTPAAAIDRGASSWLAMGNARATVTLLGIRARAMTANVKKCHHDLEMSILS